MIYNELKNSDIFSELDELIENVAIKNLFTGFGIFQEDIMFAIYQSNTFYLRAKNELATFLKENGAVQFGVTQQHPRKLKINDYYQLPLAITENKELLQSIINSSIKQVKQERIDKQKLQNERIKDLFNLTAKHERLLAKIDIKDVSSFKEYGAEECFARLVQQGYPVNLDFYWNLVAALANKNVNMLTKEEKTVSINELNLILDNFGLKRINNF